MPISPSRNQIIQWNNPIEREAERDQHQESYLSLGLPMTRIILHRERGGGGKAKALLAWSFGVQFLIINCHDRTNLLDYFHKAEVMNLNSEPLTS